MDIRKVGLLAAWLAVPVSALVNGNRATPARETSQAELAEKSVNGISPVPTSRPEMAEMELFRRDYTLPSDYCGWYADYKDASYTCGMISASCINIGNYRGCCNGQPLSCASTFYTTCIAAKSLSVSQTCGTATICCSNTNFPECGTIYFSSSANPDHTYTNVDCWSAGYGRTYRMQDYPPDYTTSSESTSTSKSSTPSPTTSTITTPTPTPTIVTPTPTPTPTPNPTPIGAIVGGVVGGVAVIALVALGIIYILRRHRHDPPAAPAADNTTAQQQQQQPPHTGYPPPQQQQQQMGQVHNAGAPPFAGAAAGITPGYDPRYSYANAQAAPPHHVAPYPAVSPDPSAGGTGPYGHPSPVASPPLPSPSSPDLEKMAAGAHGSAGPSPVHVQQHEVNEVPATNPVGVGNNRAELA